MARTLPTVLALVVLVSGVASLGNATPHASEERNGLTRAEFATLWSHDVDSAALNQSVNASGVGSPDAATLHQLAAATDITFRQPPATAGTWTRSDFDDFEPGNRSTSVAPSHATLTDSWAISDAHATLFAVQPSTVVHVNETTRRYVAPSGTGQGVVDYRIELPRNKTGPNRSETWAVVSHDVDEVRLLANGTVIAREEETQTPRLAYELEERGDTSFTLEADINATIQRTVETRTRVTNGSGVSTGEVRTRTTVTTKVDSVTVRDTLPTTVYDPTLDVERAVYPDGDTALASSSSQPVSNYTVAGRDTTIRSIWRFYTARNPDWDQLVRRTEKGNTTVNSSARPVFVHAFPAQRGVRAKPSDTRPTITNVRGPTRESPAATLGRNVTVGVTETPYTRPASIAFRMDERPSTMQAHGIVHGVDLRVSETSNVRQIRRSSLSVRVINRSGGRARLRLELRDATTDEPIELYDTQRATDETSNETDESGYVTVAGERVRTNESGIATLWLTQPGTYTARFHPASWVGMIPSYTGDTATARWHPLTTLDGWVAFGSGALARLLPLVIALYAGRRLGMLVRDWTTNQGWP